MGSSMIIVGMGNPHRSDDAVGRHVIRLLRDDPPAGAVLLELDGQVADLVEVVRQARSVIVIDACGNMGQAGRIHRLDAGCGDDISAPPAMSTHGLGLAEAVALARILNVLPERFLIYAVEGRTFAFGDGLSPDVAAAVPRVAAAVRQELGNWV